MKYVVAQLGARMHYAVPRILAQAGVLERLHTDICADTGWPRLLGLVPNRLLPHRLRRLAGRVARGIPADLITAYNWFGIEYARRIAASTSRGQPCEAFLWGGKRFGELILRHGPEAAEGVYAFNSAGLELLQNARRTGRKGVIEQTIAPKRIEVELLDTEHEKFPHWQKSAAQDPFWERYAEREELEWRVADLILCGSEFVREGIARCGGPTEKCVVVPYGVESASYPSRRDGGVMEGSGLLRVLTVGAVGLRKGSPYVLQAAKELKGKAVFRLVGNIDVSPQARDELRKHVELVGPVPRSEISEHFTWADVFLLPSVCEGSAAATYEAVAHGLPVVCTANTGSVVRDGEEGFLVPIRDVESIVERLERFARGWELRARMGGSGRARAEEFTVELYGQRLLAALGEVMPTLI